MFIYIMREVIQKSPKPVTATVIPLSNEHLFQIVSLYGFNKQLSITIFCKDLFFMLTSFEKVISTPNSQEAELSFANSLN